MDQHLRSIRLVTERYRELQGLRLVLVGLALFGCFGAFALLGAPGGTTGQAVVSVTMIAVSFPGMWLADRYYAGRFGRVVRGERRDRSMWPLVTFTVGSSVLNNWLSVGPLTFAVAFLAPMALWIAIRDWPLRAHHFLAAFAASVALWVVFTTPLAERPLAEALAMVIIGAVSIPVGVLDHRLLTRVMPKRSAEEEGATRSSAPDTERSTDRA